MVELVDTLDSKSGFFGSGGSSPPTGTIFLIVKIRKIKKPALSGFFYACGLIEKILLRESYYTSQMMGT